MTRLQTSVLEFVTRYIAQHGRSPCHEEIKRAIGSRSNGTVCRAINVLVSLGRLERVDGHERSLSVPPPGLRVVLRPAEQAALEAFCERHHIGIETAIREAIGAWVGGAQ